MSNLNDIAKFFPTQYKSLTLKILLYLGSITESGFLIYNMYSIFYLSNPSPLIQSSGFFMLTFVCGGIDFVIKALPPTTQSCPITVSPPSIEAPE